MAKGLFSKDYSIRSTPKMLFSFISTDSGLGTWFAEKASYNKDKELYNFIWEDRDHFARQVIYRPHKVSKYVFVPVDGDSDEDPSWIELKISTSELTQETFLTVTDYSNTGDSQDLEDLWDGLVANLKEQMGS
jgi:hypothetical protein